MPSLHFKGKAFVQHHHLVVPYHELAPVKSKGTSPRASLHDNVIVHGDNLRALKALLPTHAGKVKCIYIDPPYNTGNEGWAYNDNVNSPMLQDWLGKTVDRDDLTRHDKWCCMMLPRLRLLREFLTDDGALFVSIDDNEVHRLRCLLDEVFGEENFVGMIAWKNVTDNNPTLISVEHEYLVCYGRKKTRLPSAWKSPFSAVKERLVSVGEDFIRRFPDSRERQEAYTKWFRENRSHLGDFDRYKFIDEGGIYTGSQSVHNPGKEGYRYDVIHPKTRKPCIEPLMGYRFPPETMKQLLADERILFGEDETKIIELKVYAKDYQAKLSSVIELDTRLGANEVKEIFPESKRPFQFPKPTAFVCEFLQFATDKDSLVLDSFAGSGTTAHAVLALNQADGGNRRFVLIEGEDYADTITAERVRRVIKGVPSAKDPALRAGLGGTFSYFELGRPLSLHSILEGKDLPDYAALASYLFFTATGEEFDPRQMKRKEHFIGTSRLYDVFLLYTEDLEKLKGLALTLEVAQALRGSGGKRKLVFAPTKYLDEHFLDRLRITFQQLPFQIYQALDR